VSRRKPLIVVREKSQVVAFFGGSLLICKAKQTGAAQNLRESHGMLRNKSKEVATVWSQPPDL
jgi:hypothetical protein